MTIEISSRHFLWHDYTKQHGNYTEAITYDANITSLQRYGMLNDKSFGLIDDQSIVHNGNQITSVSDAVDENLNYEGAFDFADGDDKNKEYAYNGNGALTMDLNRGIDKIEYDLLGNPQMITLSGGRTIEYVYSADGRRLRTKHTQKISIGGLPLRGKTNPVLLRIFSDSTDYIGNFILKNGKPQMYLFAGGYYSFDGENTPECHYYIADYQGNNRMVVNARTNEVEQVTHYYPYGGIIGNLSSNQDVQKYKFGNKELDRTYGLDLDDVEARQYDAIIPMFTSIDPMAEKYYSISPYAYCAGNPVNLVDPDGKDTYNINTSWTDGRQSVTIERKETNDDYDMVYVDGEKNGQKLTDKSIMKGLMTNRDDSGNSTIMYTSSTNSKEMRSLYFYLADNSNVEWSASKYSDGTIALGAFEKYSTSNKKIEGAAPARFDKVGNIANEQAHIHSHLSDVGPSFADQQSIVDNLHFAQETKPSAIWNDISTQYLYNRMSGSISIYNKGGVPVVVPNANKKNLLLNKYRNE